MHVFFKPEESKFRRCRTASQLHDGAWGHSAELRIALQGAADICKDPHKRTSMDVKFIHEAPAAEIAKMNWQRMESDRYVQEATGEEMHKLRGGCRAWHTSRFARIWVQSGDGNVQRCRKGTKQERQEGKAQD